MQALVLLNDIQFVEAARALAESTLKNHAAEKEVSRPIQTMFLKLTGRSATKKEMELLVALYQKQLANFEAAPDRATQLLAIGESKISSQEQKVQLAATTVVAQTIMSLDATIWSR